MYYVISDIHVWSVTDVSVLCNVFLALIGTTAGGFSDFDAQGAVCDSLLTH